MIKRWNDNKALPHECIYQEPVNVLVVRDGDKRFYTADKCVYCDSFVSALEVEFPNADLETLQFVVDKDDPLLEEFLTIVPNHTYDRYPYTEEIV